MKYEFFYIKKEIDGKTYIYTSYFGEYEEEINPYEKNVILCINGVVNYIYGKDKVFLTHTVELDSHKIANKIREAIAFILMQQYPDAILYNTKGFKKYSNYDTSSNPKLTPYTKLPLDKTINGRWYLSYILENIEDVSEYINLIANDKFKQLYLQSTKELLSDKRLWYSEEGRERILNTVTNNLNIVDAEKKKDEPQQIEKKEENLYVIKSASDIKATAENVKAQKEIQYTKTLQYVMTEIENASNDGNFEVSLSIFLNDKQVNEFTSAGYRIEQKENETIIKW